MGDMTIIRKEGLAASIPVALATVTIGLTFGVLAEPLIGAVPAVMMSALVWAGGAQFAAIAVVGAGGGLLPAALTGITANVRYLPMGFAIAPSVKGSLPRRIATASLLTDATLLIGRGDDSRFDVPRMVWATPLQYLGWVGGTAAGALGAGVIGDPGRLGLDVMFPVFFLGLLLPELRGSSRRRLVVAGVAAVVTLVLVPVAPVGVPVLAGACVALTGLRRPRDSEEDRR